MPCHAAVSDKFLSLPASESVESALKQMKKKKLEYAAVEDEGGQFIGIFSYRFLVQSILPVSVPTKDGYSVNLPVKAAPGIAKRLKKAYPLEIGQFTDTRVRRLAPATPIWEGVNAISEFGAPMAVVDPSSGKALGLITDGSMFEELQRMQD